MKLGFAILAIAAIAAGQSSNQKLDFDVASVKPATIPTGVTLLEGGQKAVGRGSGVVIPPNTGGPGTGDPGRIHYPLISLKQLLRRAWDSYYEIDGPGWLDSTAVTVDATMPPNTTNAQFQEMLRNLIAERFGLQFHVGKKEITGYTMAIAKGGPKLKRSADQSDAEFGRPKPPTSSDIDGFPIYLPFTGKQMMTMTVGNRSRVICQQETIEELAKKLSRDLHTTVTDATGLTAKYDFTLTFASPEAAPPEANAPGNGAALEPLPDLFAAIQSQLGIKLERKPQPVEIFVIDHMEKTPTGN